MNDLLVALMECVRERVLPVKLAAERAFVYVLKMNTSEGLEYMENVTKGLSKEIAKSIKDYVVRVISKISQVDSDEDDK